jgi:streptogramin lyase
VSCSDTDCRDGPSPESRDPSLCFCARLRNDPEDDDDRFAAGYRWVVDAAVGRGARSCREAVWRRLRVGVSSLRFPALRTLAGRVSRSFGRPTRGRRSRGASAELRPAANRPAAHDALATRQGLYVAVEEIATELPPSDPLQLGAPEPSPGGGPASAERAPGRGKLRAGEQLGGFVIEGVAGRGGMAVVYRARDPQLDRIVALKVIAPFLANEPSFRSRFIRESRIAASIDHVNVLPVYTAGEERGQLYIAMRFVEGRDLAVHVREQGCLGVKDAVAIVAELAGALDAAHARGLVHRDVKPANALIEEAPGTRVYLADFGLCREYRSVSEMTKLGQPVGTVAYSAPEQLRGEPVDARADIYALGGLFYTLITGSVPFPANSDAEALAAHLHQTPPRPSQLAPNVPRGVDAVVARAMAKDPGRRYPSAGDLARAAAAAVHGSRLPADHGSVASGLAAPQSTARSSRPVRARMSQHVVVRGLLVLAAVGIAGIVGARLLDSATPAPRDAAGHLAGPPIRLTDLTPNRVTEADGAVWALETEGGSLARVDTRTRTVTSVPEPYDLGGQSRSDVDAARGSVWVTNASPSDGAVDRVFGSGGAAGALHVPLPAASAVAVGPQAVWATSNPGVAHDGSVVRIDARSGRITARRTVGREPVDIALTTGDVWVALSHAGDVIEIDPDTLRVLHRVHVGVGISRLAADGEDLWVLDRSTETVSRIDSQDSRIIGTPLSLGKELQDIAAGGGSLWVAASDSTLTRVNHQGTPVGTPIIVGAPPLSLASDTSGVWVASATDDSISRVEFR